MKTEIIIGTRASKLAEIQARSVLAALTQVHPHLKFIIQKVKTSGDISLGPFKDWTQTGMFVKEIQHALLNSKVDVAVHSLKDLPVQEVEGLQIAAVTERLDPRDVFISRGEKLRQLAAHSTVGTGSPRRIAQLRSYRPDLNVVEIRGNVDSRLKKVFNGTIDGIIVAASAIIRLGWEDRITEYLPLDHFLPQAAQGTLGIEIRADDDEMRNIVAPLNHETTWQCVASERRFLEAMGGGCSQAIACLATVEGDRLSLRGMAVLNERVVYAVEKGDLHQPGKLADDLAQRLSNMGTLSNGGGHIVNGTG